MGKMVEVTRAPHLLILRTCRHREWHRIGESFWKPLRLGELTLECGSRGSLPFGLDSSTLFHFLFLGESESDVVQSAFDSLVGLKVELV